MSRDDVPKNNLQLTPEQWVKLSDKMVEITRYFNNENWNSWSTSGWRMMGDANLRELLDIIDPEWKVIINDER